MATCVVVIVRVVQLRRKRRRAVELGMDADERRFKRRLEQSIQEVDDIFAEDDEDDDDGDLDDDVGLSGQEREQLKLIEAEATKRGTPSRGSGTGAAATPSRGSGAGAAATPASAPGTKGKGRGAPASGDVESGAATPAKSAKR